MRRRLRELQDKALDEFSGTPFKLAGIEGIRDQTYGQFKALGLSNALRSMAGFSKPDDVEKLKALVLQQAKDFPLSNLFATSYADHEAREVAPALLDFWAADPQYGWYSNVVYSTFEHLRTFREHDSFPLHRHSFAPVAQAELSFRTLAAV